MIIAARKNSFIFPGGQLPGVRVTCTQASLQSYGCGSRLTRMVVSGSRHPVEALLHARGSSKRWLARKLRMHDTQLNKYLSGALKPPANLYERIADVLNVPVAFVLPTADVPPEPTEPLAA